MVKQVVKEKQLQKWDLDSYRSIAGVQVTGDDISVTFKNGDQVTLTIASINTLKRHHIDWAALTIDSFEFIVPAKPQHLIVPWDVIRVLTDEEFNQHMVNAAQEQAILLGVRIKELRLLKNFKRKDLAKKARVTAQTISRIENGHVQVNFSTLKKILGSMGCSLTDLVRQDE